jgi:hypothetical protein
LDKTRIQAITNDSGINFVTEVTDEGFRVVAIGSKDHEISFGGAMRITKV